MPGAFDVSAGAWSSDVPISTDAWKRALHRRPPNNFCVKVLPPEKHGSSYSYGLRVFAIKDDNASIVTRTSISGASIASVNEYDIWRKWEDCLLFQDALENEYARAAREKRNRLAAGKGVKKNGVYIHSDQAASWESLPFGPDPNDVARDIHKHIPQLTKKGTLFRASQETIDRRYQDLFNMMEALFEDDDLPTLIKELKATTTFTDFFGIWRRDVDLAKKVTANAKKPATAPSRTSMSASMFSAFPVSPASLSSMKITSGKGKGLERAKVSSETIIHSDCSSSEDSAEQPRPSRVMDRKQEDSMRPRCSSSESRSSSSLPSTPVTASRQLPSTSHQPVIASQEALLRFDHNPHALGSERRSSVLESLPEDREFSSSPKSDPGAVLAARRASSTASWMNRSARIYVPSQSFDSSSEPSSRPLSRYSRASLQSVYSPSTSVASAYLDALDVDYCLPSPTPEPRCRVRASVSSLASLVTNSSVDAVIPRSERPSRSYASNAQRPSCEPWSEDESEDQEDILDAYFSDLIRPRAPTPEGFPETPTLDEGMYRFSQTQSSSTTSVSSSSRYSDRRSSFATSISSGSTSSSGNPMILSIKAMHEDNIIMLRLPRYTTFDELRRKIYDKFMQTDGSTICETFAIALLETSPNRTTAEQRPRADSLSSLGSAQVKRAALHFISSQDRWDNVVATHPSKMLLRIIGSRA